MMTRHGAAFPVDDKGACPAGVNFQSGNIDGDGDGDGDGVSAPGAALDRTIAGTFEWDVTYHPIGPRVNKRNVFANDQANTVTAPAVTRGVFDQAVQFAAWCACSKTAQELIVSVGPGAVPVLKSTLASPAYLAGPPTSVKIIPD